MKSEHAIGGGDKRRLVTPWCFCDKRGDHQYDSQICPDHVRSLDEWDDVLGRPTKAAMAAGSE